MSKQFDVVVIGGGPGGYIAAIRAAQLGFQVACVDEWKNATGGPALGGTCTNVGCIPSKALLQSSEHFDQANHHFADHGIEMKGVSMDVAKMIARKDNVVKQNNDGVLYLFKKNKVSFFHGRAAFSKAVEGGYEVTVTGAANETLLGKNIIVATGSNIMKGYYKDPEATAETLRGGWLHTGDLRKLDEEGFLYIVDRKKDMYISGGENVYPAEVEAVIAELVDVAECAVIGVPSCQCILP